MIREAALYLKRHLLQTVLSSLGAAVAVGCLLCVHYLSVSLEGAMDRQLGELGLGLTSLKLEGRKIRADQMEAWKEKGILEAYSAYEAESFLSEQGPMALIRVTDGLKDLLALELKAGELPAESGAVLGSACARELSIAQEGALFFRGQEYPVSGILEEGSASLAGELDSAVLLWDGGQEYAAWILRVHAGREGEFETIVRAKYGEAAKIASFQELGSSLEEVYGLAERVLAGVGMISFLVAGFGMASLAAMDGRHRIPEWGIRKSLGAGRKEIFTELVAEALLTGLLGFAEGMGLSIALISWFSLSMDFPWALDIPEALRLGSLTMAVFLAASLLPALHASRIPADQCLREK